MRKFIVFCIIAVYALGIAQIYAAEKNWSGGGDGSTWVDDDNWSGAVAPSASDDVLIDVENVSVICNETFKAKSIIIGGRETSHLTTKDFIFGEVKPASTSGVAMMTRSGGTVTLSGAGILTLGGKYQDSEETLDPEPSFMFWVK